MKKYIYSFLAVTLLFTAGCNDKEFLNKAPQDIFTRDQVWKKESVAKSVVADFYNRLADGQRTDTWWNGFLETMETYASFSADYWRNGKGDYGYDLYFYWDYSFIRDMNVFLEDIQKADEQNVPSKKRFIAEVKYMRAFTYFELVKREGGVPLILEPQTYDLSGNIEQYQVPRSKESEVYDFIISEMEAIKDDLPADPAIRARATKALALATEERAALYAASIARYGVNTPTETLPGGEVGIDPSKADAYYAIALKAGQDIIDGKAGSYSLYKVKPDLQENFANLFLDKSNQNHEVIFVKDYQLPTVTVNFTEMVMPKSLSDRGADGGRLNATLNLVQEFELLDNTFAPLKTTDDNGDPVFYANQEDIFANRDARLGGSVIYPGATFRGRPVDIWAGFIKPDGSTVSGTDVTGVQQNAVLEGGQLAVKAVGSDGPMNNKDFTAQTGFYLRKYVDIKPGSGQSPGSEVWWIRYRYADVLLMAAEAAFELNDKGTAVNYINEVRQRAGFTIDLTPSQITFDRIVHERKVEFAFEGLRFFDLKRWRIADKIFNGNQMTATDLTQNIGKADKVSTNAFALWPYKYYAPDDPNNGKWVYKIVKPTSVNGNRNFRLGNYYSYIHPNDIANNPKLVKNPNQ